MEQALSIAHQSNHLVHHNLNQYHMRPAAAAAHLLYVDACCWVSYQDLLEQVVALRRQLDVVGYVVIYLEDALRDTRQQQPHGASQRKATASKSQLQVLMAWPGVNLLRSCH